ncbi:hypothetical protein DV735_g4084, partial [Chaetothyriales sp. CBS 134920]
MPATPRASRRRSGTPPQTPSPQKPHSSQHAASVQDRIREWQAHGAASALDPDAVSLRSPPLSEAGNGRSNPASPLPVTPLSVPARRGRLAESGKDQRPDDRGGRSTSSAPPRRLVSDQHWRAERETGEPRPSSRALKDSITTPHYDLTYTSNQRREERIARRERRRQSRLERQSVLLENEYGRKESKKAESPPTTVDDLNSYIDRELAQQRSRTPPMDEDEDGQGSLHLPRTRRTQADGLGPQKPGNNGLAASKSKSKGAAVFFKAKDIFGRYEKPVGQRGPSIEAWLNEQPDPFVENEARPDAPQETADANAIWDSVSTAAHDQASPVHPRDTSWTYGDETLTHDPSPRADAGAPSVTIRRGARTRRARHKPSVSHESSAMDHSNFQPDPVPLPEPRQQTDRLCPPTGTHQLSTIASVETLEGQTTPLPPPPPPPDVGPDGEEPTLKRKLTTHEDLMSVLSLPTQRKSTRSRRRTQQPRQSQSAEALLASLAAEEEKYGRELRTLVDGVIPVLLQCVLSKSDSLVGAGLFTSSTDADGIAFTKPIVDMGVALERLKSLHSRIPTHSVDALLGWAHTAQRSYHAYLTAWRLGFQDVVVNLEPLANGDEVDQGMSRDADGDVVDATGKKVDVAYLLKRPLVRVKSLSKTFESIKEISDRPSATEVAATFAELTALARRRFQDEQGRLEDEAAARIDSTRARDIRTLAATTKASINPARRVRARDSFSLSMYHSTGQRLDCRIEMILRDNPPDSPTGGDVLICEIDESGKWLLFPPVELGSISARHAEDRFDLVVMVRGPAGLGKEWHELLALTADDDPETVSEWMSMLGSSPLPPKLNRTQSFKEAEKTAPKPLDADKPPASVPSVSEVDIPLGEPSVIGRKEAERPQAMGRSNNPFERFMGLNLGGGLQSKPQQTWKKQDRPQEKAMPAWRGPSGPLSDRSTVSDQSIKEASKTVKVPPTPKTAELGKGGQSPQDHRTPRKSEGLYMMSGGLGDGDCPPRPSPDRKVAEDSSPEAKKAHARTPLHMSDSAKKSQSAPTTPIAHKAEAAPNTSAATRSLNVTAPNTSAATRSLNVTAPPNKLRRGSDQKQADRGTPLNATIQQHWDAAPTSVKLRRRSGQRSSSASQVYTEDVPKPPTPSTLHVGLPSPLGPLQAKQSPPAKPLVVPQPQRPGQQPSLPSPALPQLSPTSASRDDRARNRRSSSPLKHAYAPSTSSASSSDGDSDENEDSSSDTSEGFMSETKDIAMPLVAVTAAGNRRPSKFGLPPPSTAVSSGTRTLAPSDSASQGPYRKVPSSAALPGGQKSKTIAMVCSWSDKGVWEQIHPDECSIVISPGLIEAFEMSSAHSGDKAAVNGSPLADTKPAVSSANRDPLVAFELTPIVPLRRGTALDINIRSPPTANSKLRTTNNIMFRSRNADECDALYSMINWARCNNPTYIQLQKARPPQAGMSFNTGSASPKGPESRGFLGLHRHSSYRASSHPAARLPSVGGDSEASAGTLSSAFSALKRFGFSSPFNLNRSSVTWQTGRSRATASLYSSESGTLAGSGSGKSTPQPSQLGLIPGKDGPNVPGTSAEAANGGGMVNNMKIRLYVRKGQHWENLGPGRLTVMPAEEERGLSRPGTSGETAAPAPSTATPPRAPPSGASTPTRGPQLPSAEHTPNRLHGNGKEKRIIVRKAKDDNVVLLDATLGESCFERVMQTGIAVKVWDENDTIAHKGGVVMGHGRVYMMQFPGTREAGWVFGLCGTYRRSDLNLYPCMASSSAHLLRQPPEVLHVILTAVEPRDLARLSQTCRELRDSIANDLLLWKRQYLQHFDCPASHIEDETADSFWQTQLQDLVTVDRILSSGNTSLKNEESSLEKIYAAAMTLLTEATSKPDKNSAFLARHFARESNIAAFLARSSLFASARYPSNTPASSFSLRQASAKLFVYYGLEIEPHSFSVSAGRATAIHPFARSRVYDLRRYTPANHWGPFFDDGSDGIDWEKVQCILIVILYNLRLSRCAQYNHRLCNSPFHGLAPKSFTSVPLNRKTDPYGVTGTWMRIVCFLDYSDLYRFNFESPPLPESEARPPIETREALRLIRLQLHVTKIEWPDDDDSNEHTNEDNIARNRPIVHFEGSSKSTHVPWDPNANSTIRGTVRTTRTGDIRWTTLSVFQGEERWRSESIQIGGIRSGRGAIGTWFDKDYDHHGPVGPTYFWKRISRLQIDHSSVTTDGKTKLSVGEYES